MLTQAIIFVQVYVGGMIVVGSNVKVTTSNSDKFSFDL